LLLAHFDTGHYWAQGYHDGCTDKVPNAPPCYPQMATAFVCQTILIILVLGLLLTASKLAECYGDKVYEHDLGLDLDSLWQESQNVLASAKGGKRPLPRGRGA
jgi:hypothetical protein